jgi:cilia- and flagella-associated protein 52
MDNYELGLKAVIGQQQRHKDCFVVHPSEDYVVYSLGSIIVIKSLIDLTTEYLKGHEGQICVITVSKSGKLLGTGEQVQDAGF